MTLNRQVRGCDFQGEMALWIKKNHLHHFGAKKRLLLSRLFPFLGTLPGGRDRHRGGGA